MIILTKLANFMHCHKSPQGVRNLPPPKFPWFTLVLLRPLPEVFKIPMRVKWKDLQYEQSVFPIFWAMLLFRVEQYEK